MSDYQIITNIDETIETTIDVTVVSGGGGGGGGSSDSFKTIAVSGQSDVVADSATDTLTLVAGSNVTITTNATTDTITIAATGGGGGSSNSFETIAVSGQSSVVADSATDTLTIVAGTNVTITTNSSTDTITINSSQTNITGNAATVTTNANLTGPITSVGNATTIADPELAAIAGLTSAADKGIQFTGVGTAATYDLTAAGKAILDDADASAQRTTLGLGTLSTQSGTFSGTSSGTNTGDQTITLTGDVTGSGTGSFAATIPNDTVTYGKIQNVTATDKILGRSTAGAGDIEEIDCTAAGRALLDDIDASAQRTTLGLGTLATQSGTFSGTSSGTNTGDQNLFSTIAVSGQSSVVADAASDTLTLVAGSNITITTNAGTDEITIAASGGGGSVATDTIWDASGDLVVGTGANTAARLAPPTGVIPSNLHYGPNGVEWVNSSTHLIFREDFILSTVAGWTNHSASGAGYAGNAEVGAHGVWEIATGTAVGTGRQLVSSANVGLAFGDGEIWCTWRIKIVTLSTGSEGHQVRVGFFDSDTITDGAYFQYTDSVNSGNWQVVTESNTSATTTNTSTAATTSWTSFCVNINAAGTQVRFYINGTLVHTETNTIPTGASRLTSPAVGIIKTVGTASARTLRVDFCDLYEKFTTPR